jgi:hypothetical protein
VNDFAIALLKLVPHFGALPNRYLQSSAPLWARHTDGKSKSIQIRNENKNIAELENREQIVQRKE